ncbi:uncharacterized protein B0P05DRAFT_520836 [Gilbertella persicaria]|uniref:uncharacterized protein n=1 Tax=Gilbertella persicaria TaxID=101096 RepID=UPI00221F5FCB|nr:uncharacterized protein B0P05DRAFT_520836 [Gilbertella persicaria]KAI8098188.1 hypothetical protein B0P05DRAFT_520836 [Gilbertella persicaria]
MSSAINSKNRKKKNKNKNKKKQTAAITQETPEPVVTTAANMAIANAVQVASGGGDDTIVGATDNLTATLGQTNKEDRTPLPDYVQHGIHSAVASQSIDVYRIVKKISSDVQSGEYKEKEMPVQNDLLAGTAIQQQEKELPIQNKSLAETEAIEASSHTETKPVDIIQQQELPVQNKSFAETEALSHIEPADTIRHQEEEALPVQNKSFAETEAIEASHEASTMPHETSHKNARPDSPKPELPSKDTTKKATIGATMASVGAAAVVAAKSKSSKKQEDTSHSKPLPTPNESSTPPPPVSKDTITTRKYVMSDNVKHCVDSAIKAPSVNVDRIMHASKDIQRPEPAIGSSNESAMPSFTKTSDVSKKAKSPEQRRSNKPSFWKKKSCIIL